MVPLSELFAMTRSVRIFTVYGGTGGIRRY